MPKLSIVVPFHSVEPYLAECLESLAIQTWLDHEVIMVDDGSPDGSAVIAKSFADRDARFKLIQQENQGLGPARNTGVAHATGDYLAFADSDDLVARNAYAILVGSLEETGSDIACGNVCRFDASRTWQSQLHTEPFSKPELRTHVRRKVSLMRDRTAWNKVFRRSFWDAHGLEFPGSLYEDSPVTIKAHVLAKSVDVHRERIYYWRQRAGSITDGKGQMANLEARIAMVEGVQGFLLEHAPELQPVWDRHALDVDLPVLIEALVEAPEPERGRMAELGREFLNGVAPESFADHSAMRRLKYHLLRRGLIDELAEVQAFDRAKRAEPRLVRRGVIRPRWYGNYPFLDDPQRRVPLETYDVTDELTLVARADTIRWAGDRLQVEGHAYLANLDCSTTQSSRIRVWLCTGRGRRLLRSRIEVPVTRVRRPEVTASSGQPGVSYDWCGFVLDIDPDQLRRAEGSTTTWGLEVEVASGGVTRRGMLRNPTYGREKWQPDHELTGGFRVQPIATAEGRFVLRAGPVTAQLDACDQTGEALELRGWTLDALGPNPVIRVSRRYGGGWSDHPVELTSTAGNGQGFVARVQLSTFTSVSEETESTPGHVIPLSRFSDGVDWDVVLRDSAGHTHKLALARHLPESRHQLGRQEIAVTRTLYGNLRVVERTCRPVVTRIDWLPDDRLALAGDFADPDERPETLVLRARASKQEHHVALFWSGRRFRAEIPVSALPMLGGHSPLAPGSWDLLARTRNGELPVLIERGGIQRLRGHRVLGGHEVAVDVHATDALHLWVRVALPPEERGAWAQARLRNVDYPRTRQAPIEDLVVFTSFRGRQFSDSPRAIHEELLRRDTGLECAWVVNDGLVCVPDGATPLIANSRAHYEALARARYVISNDPQPEWFLKRPGQFYLQTWHGTPLKRIGFDIDSPTFANAQDYLRRFAADVAQWDALVSPNPFSTPIMQRAFGYQGEVLETGYPRNDLLLAPDRAENAARIRDRLGIPAGKRVVLYAPTWRDDSNYTFDLRLDLAAARRALGDDHLVLFRGHFNTGSALRGPQDDFVLDVTYYPDIADLYLIADVLVTDYSSVMFDFAVTGRPMLFFTYDLEHYRDRLRGFYFDFESDAPGPLLRTSDDVIEALADLDEAVRPFKAAHEAFVERFCPLDDGSAAARVVDRLLAELDH